MKTKLLKTILMSAYLSAMLASNVVPVRSDATLAAAFDPMAAQQALQRAANGLGAAGWSPVMASASVAAAPSFAVPSGSTLSSPEPVISEELMARLIKRTLQSTKDSRIDKQIAAILGLNDGSADLPAKQISYPTPEGKHTILVCTQAGRTDIVIAFVRANVNEIYLVDKTGKLRAASIWDLQGIRLITNEQAAAKHNAELAHFAKEAANLPPTGTAVASNR